MRARRDGRPAWPVVSAWALWLLAVLTLAAVPLLDRLLRQAGRRTWSSSRPTPRSRSSLW